LPAPERELNPPSEWHYVAAAYGVVFVAVLVWVAIIGAKLQRLQRQIGELVEQERHKRSG
jgi:CcmD family protein